MPTVHHYPGTMRTELSLLKRSSLRFRHSLVFLTSATNLSSLVANLYRGGKPQIGVLGKSRSRTNGPCVVPQFLHTVISIPVNEHLVVTSVAECCRGVWKAELLSSVEAHDSL